MLALKPDVLSILIGTNDVGEYLKKPEADFDLQNWENRYRVLLLSARVCLSLIRNLKVWI